MIEVVIMAARVPIGIDFWASRRSPDRFDPAMIPVGEGEGGRDWQVVHTARSQPYQ